MSQNFVTGLVVSLEYFCAVAFTAAAAGKPQLVLCY